MKTRTLMLLALGCGVAIMSAGAVFLFQLAGQEDLAEPIAVGEVTTVGDMSVTVDRAEESNDVLDVTVTIGGVDDPDGASGFRLIASGRPVVADRDGAGSCLTTSVVPAVCRLRFDVSTADGSSRVLFYERGDQQVRWVLG